MNKIDKFRGKNYFLSNFFEHYVEYEGLLYPNNEAAFQAAKLVTNKIVDPKTKLNRLSFTKMTPKEAKAAGRKVSLRPDWEKVKLRVMTDIVRSKFVYPELEEELLATGTLKLAEGNTWHDTFWGFDINTNRGQNHLGKILMKVRQELNDKYE